MNSKKYKDTLYEFRYINDLKEMIDSAAELYVDEPAFMVKDVRGGEYRKISFKHFKADIDALGTKFIEMGLKDKKIAVIGENSYKWVVTYMATVNGTGVIVPLDKELPVKEIHHLLERAGVDAIVHSKKLTKNVKEAIEGIQGIQYRIAMDEPEHSDEALSFDRLIEAGQELLNQGMRDFVDAIIDREAMCTLIFTSGTTGMAKGVMLSHKNISANVYNMSKYVKIRYPGTGLSVLPMHHTFEMTCHVCTGLYQGCCIAICEGLKHIQKNLQESKATVMLGVPLVFETMHKRVFKQVEKSGRLPAFKKLMTTSRKLKLYNKPKVVKKMFSQLHQSIGGEMALFIAGGAAIEGQVIRDYETMGVPMIQGYGMTENAPIIAVNKDYYSKSDSVGLPMPGTEIKIVDQDEDGVGEIICKGPSVMIGYYNDPELTAETIRDGWLYTGDYGYFDEDGFLYVSGRKKNVIVTKNGKNIFPEEVEFYMLKSPYIEEILVFGEEDKRTGDTVVSAEIYPEYNLIREALGEDVSDAGIRDFLKEIIDDINDQMPLYKRVKRFQLRWEEFEKTTTRKIKRRYTKEVPKEED